MLKKRYRLKSNSAFIATYRQCKVVSDEFFTLYAGRLKEESSQTTTQTPTRFGFVVSKKIHKRAVKRNRIKRLMRESIRLSIKNRETGAANSYMSLVFVAKEPSLGLGFNTAQKSILSLINKLEKKYI